MDPIYRQLADERLFEPASPCGVEDPHQLPAVTPTAGAYDDLVEPTWNGLRPEDLRFPQPPQDPEWRPDGDR